MHPFIAGTMFVFLMVGLSAIASAKVGDPSAIQEGQYLYLSHANYVEKVKANSRSEYEEASAKGKAVVVWHTVLYESIDPPQYIPGLEKDVQWNIICSIEMKGKDIVAKNKNGCVYVINKSTGKAMGGLKSGRCLDKKKDVRLK